MIRFTIILLITIMLIVLGCGIATQPPKLNWCGVQDYSVPSPAIQRMLDVAVYIKIQLDPWKSAIGGSGSGVIVDANEGIILTNSHVAKDVVNAADSFHITTNDGSTYICGRDSVILYPGYDLALIRIGKPLNLPSAVLTDVVPGVGERVMVVGSPMGEVNINSLSAGIISGVCRLLRGAEHLYFVQTDAAINPGSSGGPWFDSNGRVFAISARSFRLAQNLGYGIPMEYLRKATN